MSENMKNSESRAMYSLMMSSAMVRHCVGLRREELAALCRGRERYKRWRVVVEAHTATFLYRPSMKDFDILQKFGSGVSIASETFLTIVCMASQISCPPDCAV